MHAFSALFKDQGEREGNLLHHPLGLERAIHDQLGMQAAEGLGHVAVPADGLVRGEDLGKLLWAELPPLGSPEIPA